MLRSLTPHALRLTTVIALGLSAMAAQAETVTKTSPHSVAVTIDRLEAAVTEAGANVVARVDHAAAATTADLELRPTQVLIFGNPKLGTPAMIDAQTAALDLPLRVLAYEDAGGIVHVVYHTPATLAETHGLPADAPYLVMMTGALDKLTGAAIAPE
jgi:uncharacterized protein (DUF302 family)